MKSLRNCFKEKKNWIRKRFSFHDETEKNKHNNKEKKGKNAGLHRLKHGRE